MSLTAKATALDPPPTNSLTSHRRLLHKDQKEPFFEKLKKIYIELVSPFNFGPEVFSQWGSGVTMRGHTWTSQLIDTLGANLGHDINY